MVLLRRLARSVADRIVPPVARRYFEPIAARAQEAQDRKIADLKAALSGEIAAVRDALAAATAATAAQHALSEHHRLRAAQFPIRAEIAALRDTLARETPGNPA